MRRMERKQEAEHMLRQAEKGFPPVPEDNKATFDESATSESPYWAHDYD